MTSVLSKIKMPGAKISPTGHLEEKKDDAPEPKPERAVEKGDLPPMLEVRDLKVYFRVMKGTVHAVDGVDLTLRRGETLGLVGESGCGKTTLAYAINRLLPGNGGVVAGSIKFEGQEVGVPEAGCTGEILGLLDSRDPLDPGLSSIVDKEKRAIAALKESKGEAGDPAGEQWRKAEIAYREAVLRRVEKALADTANLRDEVTDPLTESEKKEDAKKAALHGIAAGVGGAVGAAVAGRAVGETHAQRAQRRKRLRKRMLATQTSFLLKGLRKRRDALLAQRVNKIRWKEVSMIFQSAMNAFNPVFKVGDQIMEALLAHEPLSKEDARERTIKLFELVGIDPGRIDGYPHEFSGGMKQRAMIAMALACNPKLVLADEPTTALDVIMQDRVLAEIRDLQRKFNMALIIITHDISVVAETANKIAIMYAGHIMEYGDIASIFRKPCNPYTIGLLAAYPKITGKRSRLLAIPGTPPDLVNPPSGCRFHPRCRFAQDICKTAVPPRVEVEKEHYSMCHFAKEIHSGELR
jgi:peptide/nickel transport system ATP-binding protein